MPSPLPHTHTHICCETAPHSTEHKRRKIFHERHERLEYFRRENTFNISYRSNENLLYYIWVLVHRSSLNEIWPMKSERRTILFFNALCSTLLLLFKMPLKHNAIDVRVCVCFISTSATPNQTKQHKVSY